MSNSVDFNLELSLFECPFFTLCPLPKIQFLCKIPECKNCPDYTFKLKKIIS